MEEAQQDLAALGLRMAEQIRQSRAPTLLTEMVALSLKEKFLHALDPDTEIANTGRTVAQEREFLAADKESQKIQMDGFREAMGKLTEAPAEIRMTYADLVMRDGELAAARYLISELGTPKP